jgi:hypothetical protein
VYSEPGVAFVVLNSSFSLSQYTGRGLGSVS